MRTRDYLDGVTKIKTIMGITIFRCRGCGEPYRRKREADACCKKKGVNKSGQPHQKWRN